MEKRCFKCGEFKPLTDFYKHAQMADGRVNKCKECNKTDVKKNYRVNTENPSYIEKERTRGRKKYRRLYLGTGTTDPERNKKYANKYPEKSETRKMNCTRLVPSGMEAHHWSYNVPDRLDVIPLTKKDHMKAHRFIVYDPDQWMYRRTDNNVLLDTKESHFAYIIECVKNQPD